MRTLESLTVLLLDDNAAMRAIVTEVLRASGVPNVIDTAEPAEAWRKLRMEVVDVAIVDYNMRPVNGVEFTRRVRLAPDSPCPHLPIIMMTGHAERSRVVEARDAGVSEFIAKPVTAKVLMERLYSVIMKPRPFVRGEAFVGPDRRRVNSDRFEGPFRREADLSKNILNI